MAKINLDKVHAADYGNIETVVAPADLPNGSLVALGGFAEGEREAVTGVAPAADAELLLVAAPEVKYNEIDELDYTTPAGELVRAYHLTEGDLFQVETALFDATPAVGDIVTGSATHGYAAAGVDATDRTTFRVERVGRYLMADMVLLRVVTV